MAIYQQVKPEKKAENKDLEAEMKEGENLVAKCRNCGSNFVPEMDKFRLAYQEPLPDLDPLKEEILYRYQYFEK